MDWQCSVFDMWYCQSHYNTVVKPDWHSISVRLTKGGGLQWLDQCRPERRDYTETRSLAT